MGFRDEVVLERYVYDFDADGGATSTISLSGKTGYKSLPNPCMVLDVFLYVVTACTSGGSATVDVGNTTDPNGYMDVLAVASLADQAMIRAGEQAGALLWDDTNDHLVGFAVNSANDADLSITIATANLTAGKFLVYVSHLRPQAD